MLSKEDNELLTRVGPGTLMGDLIRQYWLPFYLSAELEADGPPVRIRLLGEDLIACRDSAGQVALLGDHCPHRGASLFFGRNEESGLRCVYHGWKYDVAGQCVDMPNEPAESNFRHKIRHTAYPCRERGGMVWAYMGPLAEPPALPDLEWTTVPDEQRHLTIRIAENNFMQPIEGEFDSTHIGFLHQGLLQRQTVEPETDLREKVLRPARSYQPGWGWGDIARQFKTPRFEVVDTAYGVLIGTRRDLGDGVTTYWRVYPFLMPFHTLIPAGGHDPLYSGHAWVPMDDERTICLCWTYNPVRPLTDQERHSMRYGVNGLQPLHPTVDAFYPAGSKPYAKYWPKLDNGNDFSFDYEAQRSGKRFSGLPGVWPQDSGMQQSMGFIYDRTKEHLGTSDTGQIGIRRRMLNAARELQEQGVVPPGVDDPQSFWLRPASAVLPTSTVSWVEAIKEHSQAGGPARGVGSLA